MGEVWRGADLAIDRPVAIKVVRPEHADDEEGLARFRAEAHHAGSLSHPNIAQVFDYGEAAPPEPGYLVMELVDGLSLTRMLDDGPLPPEDVMDVVAQAARGLAAAHRAGLVHRDIKPGNLLVRSDGLVKLTDFGIAHATDETSVTQPGVLIGTPAYLAPERVCGGARVARDRSVLARRGRLSVPDRARPIRGRAPGGGVGAPGPGSARTAAARATRGGRACRRTDPPGARGPAAVRVGCRHAG